MGGIVMNVIKIKISGESGVCRTGEKIQTAVVAEQLVAHLDNRLDRRVYEHIIITFAACKPFEIRERIGVVICIDIMQLDVARGGFFNR